MFPEPREVVPLGCEGDDCDKSLSLAMTHPQYKLIAVAAHDERHLDDDLPGSGHLSDQSGETHERGSCSVSSWPMSTCLIQAAPTGRKGR